jgi:hypothetical protein
VPVWQIEKCWDQQDVFIIGGGPSLKDFDWSLLHDEYTVGCNTAFTLGEKVCKVCVFGDNAWWMAFKDELAKYKGTVFTNVTSLHPSKIPWLWTMQRKPQGLHVDGLGWNGNTGASAINLALLLGAKRVFLLGFDMKRIADRPNWHEKVIRPAANQPRIYQGFVQDFRFVKRDWKVKFGDREIINVTDDSGLGPDVFPWVSPDKFWSDRKAMHQEDLRVRQMFIEQDNQIRADMDELDEIEAKSLPDVSV